MNALTVGDWVGFDLSFVDEQEHPLLDSFVQSFWFKLGADETESPLRQLFIGKKLDDLLSL